MWRVEWTDKMEDTPPSDHEHTQRNARICNKPRCAILHGARLNVVAHKLNHQIPNSIILDHYRYPGAGGSIAGVARRIKEHNPNCQVVGVDPHGSILALPETLNENGPSVYQVEGVGYNFIPTVSDVPIT
ncbi:hypothetical protein V9T40_014689 [Parthenolecanium corni]|uniref:Uncharacterized protein n=1 Tax=Parthenolecanium corni TaxID=536013 RepID=A0AAN9XX06_9HEMI